MAQPPDVLPALFSSTRPIEIYSCQSNLLVFQTKPLTMDEMEKAHLGQLGMTSGLIEYFYTMHILDLTVPKDANLFTGLIFTLEGTNARALSLILNDIDELPEMLPVFCMYEGSSLTTLDTFEDDLKDTTMIKQKFFELVKDYLDLTQEPTLLTTFPQTYSEEYQKNIP